MIQLYKIHSGLCITKMHTTYEKRNKKHHDLKIMAQQTTTSDFTFIRFAYQINSWTMKLTPKTTPPMRKRHAHVPILQ